MTFKRYELKYMLSQKQKSAFMEGMNRYMRPDEFGRSIIRNIYYDTPEFSLARRSIEKPVYKEKLRMRSYVRPDVEDTVFIELKKKYDSVVYKRRIGLPLKTAESWLSGSINCPDRSQVAKEIEYFRTVYKGLRPAAYISYEREAFYAISDHEFRVTFDENALARTDELTLMSEPYGNSLFRESSVLMEIKVGASMPLWCSSLLAVNNIYPYSFSKYGETYKTMLMPSEIMKEKLSCQTISSKAFLLTQKTPYPCRIS